VCVIHDVGRVARYEKRCDHADPPISHTFAQEIGEADGRGAEDRGQQPGNLWLDAKDEESARLQIVRQGAHVGIEIRERKRVTPHNPEGHIQLAELIGIPWNILKVGIPDR